MSEIPLIMKKNAFYFILKAFFVLKIFTFLSFSLIMYEKRFGEKAKVSFKIYDVTDWMANNHNIHIAICLKNWRQSENEIWSVNRI